MSNVETLQRPTAQPLITQASVEAIEAQQAAAAQATAEAALTTLRTAAAEATRPVVSANDRVRAAARAAARKILDANAALRAAHQFGDERSLEVVRRISDELEDDLTRNIVEALVESAFSRSERLEVEEETDTREAQESWATNVGNSVATRYVAQSSLDAVKPVEEHLGTELHKLWMSRADSKVRGSHRKLHGTTAALDKPFWRELGTSRVLAFPGDPRAPIEQTINCRCWLWFVPKEQAAEAEATFQMPESEFELIAASGHAHGSIYDLDGGIIVASYDADLGMAIVAATERRYEEKKHKRSATGQFADKPKGSIPARIPPRGQRAGFDREAWEARGGWDAVLQRYGKSREGDRKIGGKGGGSEKDEAKAAAREALQAQQEAEREAERERREAMREERRTAAEKLRAQRRMEDARKRGERLTEDEALHQIQEEIRETERLMREKQRDADEAMRDIERSRDYIRQMRIRGELPAIIEAERARLLDLEGKHKKIVGEVEELSEQSRKLGTSDNVRRLRDRVRFSRRAEDDQIRTDREQFDAAIRIAQARKDDEQRERESALRSRHKEQRRALTSAGGPSQSCIVCLLPVGDRQITYNDGSTSPMHMTLGYMGAAAQYDDIDREMFDISTEEIADRIPPFTGKVAGQASLGEDSDTVTLIEAPEIAQARDYVMSDGALGYAINKADEHPNWIPHVTGLSDVDYQDEVSFDRLGLWMGEDRREYPLNG